MQLPVNEKADREIVLKASLLLLAIAVNALEFFIPRIPIFPWLKPGLANIITVVWIIRYGFTESLLYVLLRIWIITFYFGFSFITFSLSFSGAICSCCAMAACWRLLGKRKILGTVGIAVIGALFHNMGQLLAVYFLMAKNSHLFYQVPLMIIASVLFGGIVGLIVPGLMRVVSDQALMHLPGLKKLEDIKEMYIPHLIISMLFLFFCMSLVFITDETLLLIAAVSVTGFVQYLVRGSLNALIFPIKKFWMLFLFVGILHNFFTYGIKYAAIPFITHEGVSNTIIQWLRLWTWLETSFVFLHFKFHTGILMGLKKIFSGYRTTLYAGLLAVEYFPSVVEMVRCKARELLKILFCKPSLLVKELFDSVVNIVISGQGSAEELSDFKS